MLLHMADPNRFRGAAKGLANAHGKLYEAHAVKSLGARLQPNSGAMVGAKGDMRKRSASSGDWMIEAKTTVNASLPLELGWLVKISEEAQAAGARPALVVSFVTPAGRPRPNAPTEWVLMPLQTFKELTDGEAE